MDKLNSYGNEERDRRLIQALDCIRLLRRRIFYFTVFQQ